jgi:hypothetical protein
VTPNEWIAWARGIVRRCREAENRLRERFGIAEEFGLHDLEEVESMDEESLRANIHGWAVGNLSARGDALRARGIRAAGEQSGGGRDG